MDKVSMAMREKVIETLELIASEVVQRDYQEKVPSIDVPAELFNQWEDCFYPDDAMFIDGFCRAEFDALIGFDRVFNEVCEETPKILPPLHEFVRMPAWQKLSGGARIALAVLKGL